MNISFLSGNMQTKNACRSRHPLVEAASLEVELSSLMISFPIKPRILRGNTEAPQKLLVHASTDRLPVDNQKVNGAGDSKI